jgi:hypothetical protein
MNLYLICYLAVFWTSDHSTSEQTGTDTAKPYCEVIEARSAKDERIEEYLTERAESLGADETPIIRVMKMSKKLKVKP